MYLGNQSHFILLNEPDKNFSCLFQKELERNQFEVDVAKTIDETVQKIQDLENQYSVLVLDIDFSDGNGLRVFEKIKEEVADIPVIIITNFASIRYAVESMQRGACDFLIKPFDPQKLADAVVRSLNACGIKTKEEMLSHKFPDPKSFDVTYSNSHDHNFGRFIGTSSAMQIIYSIIESAAGTDAPVFITGKSGTGKEICAQAIHYYSDRSQAPFIPFNCASQPMELFESSLFGHKREHLQEL